MLVGREAEQRTLNSLLDGARDDRSGVLVLRGAPGIGKTALLDYAKGRAADMQVLRCAGIEAEHELPFAGLHQLVWPCVELIERLPAPQSAALRSALGLDDGDGHDRFLVAVGLLSLLAELSESGPMLCLVDDAHWLDRPTADALAFAARRLVAEPIVLLLAARAGEARSFDAPALPTLEVSALDDDAARALLASRLDREVSDGVLAALLEAARGNPLALLELPAGLSDAQLAGRKPILGPPPVRTAVEEEFRARTARLPEETQRALLLAAADEEGALSTLSGAASSLGLDLSALEPAERKGLVRVAETVVFSHPLARSAVYRSARHAERKRAHEALAAALDDPVRSTWHRAVVADQANEGLAAELEAAGTGRRARRPGKRLGRLRASGGAQGGRRPPGPPAHWCRPGRARLGQPRRGARPSGARPRSRGRPCGHRPAGPHPGHRRGKARLPGRVSEPLA
jgi:hypothetical protein